MENIHDSQETRIVACIHDSIWVEAGEDEAVEVLKIMEKIMTTAMISVSRTGSARKYQLPPVRRLACIVTIKDAGHVVTNPIRAYGRTDTVYSQRRKVLDS